MLEAEVYHCGMYALTKTSLQILTKFVTIVGRISYLIEVLDIFIIVHVLNFKFKSN